MKVRTIEMSIAVLVMVFANTVSATPITFNSLDFEVRTSTFDYTATGGGYTKDQLETEFNSGSLIGSTSLTEIDNLTYFGRNHDYAMMLEMNITLDGSPIELDFGTDWGRGGAIFATPGVVGDHLGNTWWGMNWNNGDVITLAGTFPAQDYQMVFMGWEDRAGGPTSARWRSGDGEWQTVAINNVPEPGALALLSICLLGLGLSRRKFA